jgi:hypothetical protein
LILLNICDVIYIQVSGWTIPPASNTNRGAIIAGIVIAVLIGYYQLHDPCVSMNIDGQTDRYGCQIDWLFLVVDIGGGIVVNIDCIHQNH